jgi:hypothetical protein
MSAPIARNPSTIRVRSSVVIKPAASSAAEWAMDPSISQDQSRQSKLIDSLYFSRRSAVCVEKRPCHMGAKDYFLSAGNTRA